MKTKMPAGQMDKISPRKALAGGSKMIEGESNDFDVRPISSPNAGGEQGEMNPMPMSVPKG
jgi:hypothetical protein